MRFFTLLIWLFCVVPVFTQAHDSTEPAPWLSFIRNDHQWDKDILYRAEIPGGFLFIRHQSLQYVFYDTKAVQALHFKQDKPANAQARVAVQPTQPVDNFIRAHGFTLTFAGAHSESVIEALQPSSEKRNYFIGKDSERWASNVPAFGEIIYHNIYPGIDLRLFNYHNSLKYELLVAPGADTKQIRFQYEGAEKISIQKEQLVIQTSLNTINETKPYCYQRIKGQTREVMAHFTLNNNEVTFQFPKGYHRNQALVIDPILVFSTFSGSKSDNWGHCATFDAEDNLYAGGTVFGINFPATNGAFQVSYAGKTTDNGLTDVAIMKYNPTGTKLLYATFLGGEEAEVPHSMTVNKKGELLIMGTTSSKNFPTTTNAPFQTFGGGSITNAISGITYNNGSDLFISKLNPQGSQLLGSTFMGGSQNDGIRPVDNTLIKNYGDQYRSEIITDAQDNVYVASVTSSPDFPVRNPVQPFFSNNFDGVIFRLNPALSALEWSTPFGGQGLDAAYSLRVSSSGSLYVCGVTTSTNLATKKGALHESLVGSEDGFVAQFKNDQLVQATYVGTEQADHAMLLDLDPEDNVYILGLSQGNYPVTAGVYTNINSHQFIHKMDPALSKTLFSTVIGSGRSTTDLTPTAFLINECGNIYLSGWAGDVNREVSNLTSSTTNMPITPGAFRSTTNGDDFYIMVLEKEAKSQLYGTFFGSQSSRTKDNRTTVGRNHVDGGTSRFNKKGVIYHATCACGGSGFPTTPGAWSNTNASDNCNNAAFKFDIEALKADFDIFDKAGTKDIITGCTPFTAVFKNTSVGGITYQWDIGGQTTSTDLNQVMHTFTEIGEYPIKLVAFNQLTCIRKDSLIKTIKVLKADFKVGGNQKICLGASTQLSAEGGDHYLWSPSAGLDNPTIANPVASPTVSTTYNVKISKDNGCVDNYEVAITVLQSNPDDFDLTLSDECGKPIVVNFNNNIEGADKFIWSMGNGDTLLGATPDPYIYKSGTYEVGLTIIRENCTQTLTKTVQVSQLENPPNVVTPNGDGQNDTFFLAMKDVKNKVGVEGYKLDIYNRWGKSVYQSDYYRNDWGPGAGNGMYYYLLTSPLGAKCKGWVQVLF